MSREAKREAFRNYQNAVIAEHALRDVYQKNAPRDQRRDVHIDLVKAIGRTAECRAALDDAILDDHDLTKPKT